VNGIDKRLVRQLHERAEGRGPGIVHQDVDAAQTRGRLLDEALAARKVA